MQEVSQGQLDVTFPKKYLEKFAEHKKRSRQLTLGSKRRRTSGTSQVFSGRCKQAIRMARAKVYCCVLKEAVEGGMCKACPCHEPEPLEYTLFKRE